MRCNNLSFFHAQVVQNDSCLECLSIRQSCHEVAVTSNPPNRSERQSRAIEHFVTGLADHIEDFLSGCMLIKRMSGVSEEASKFRVATCLSVILEGNRALIMDAPQAAPGLCWIRCTLSENQNHNKDAGV